MENDFYLTAPSTTSYIGNTAADFTIPLHTPLIFNKPYKVALTEISIPFSYKPFDNIKNRSFFYSIFDKKVDQHIFSSIVTIPNEFYTTILDLISSINASISTVINTLDESNIIEENQKLKLEYVSIYKKVKIVSPPSDYRFQQNVRFLPHLANILGFNTSLLYPQIENVFGEETVFNSTQMCIINVLLDIISSEWVGNSKIQLLRQISITKNYDDIINVTFNNLLYKEVIPREIQTLRFKILDQNGEYIPFTKGDIIAVLHFSSAKT